MIDGLESVINPFKHRGREILGYNLVEQSDTSTGETYHTYQPYYQNTRSPLFWPGINLLSLGKLYLCYELLF